MPSVYSTKVKVLSQTYFEPPVVSHLIEADYNVRSLMACTVLCATNSVCRTADYNSSTKICRLFETFSSMGMYLYDTTTSTLVFNYCVNDTQTEPEYVCTRSGAFTVQQILDSLYSASTKTLPSTDRGAYANAYGVYTSTSSGSISFISYAGVYRSLVNLSSEVSNIYPSGSSGLAIVQYFLSLARIYTNVGSLKQPQLALILNISLPGSPYSCLTTSTYLYIAYANANPIMTIHDLSTGAILNSANQTYLPNRPVLGQWNDTVFIIDQNNVFEYTLTGVSKGSWSYPFSYQFALRNSIDIDYAGRIFTYNANTTSPGIFAFLQNGTMLANKTFACYRGFQVHLTKDQAILINIPALALMQIVNF